MDDRGRMPRRCRVALPFNCVCVEDCDRDREPWLACDLVGVEDLLREPVVDRGVRFPDRRF